MRDAPTLNAEPTPSTQGADRGTELGTITRLLTGLLLVVFRLRVVIERLGSAAGRVLDIGVGVLWIVERVAVVALGGLSLYLAFTARSSPVGRVFWVLLGIALLGTALPRRVLVCWRDALTRRLLRAAAWAKLELAARRAPLAALASAARRLLRIVGRLLALVLFPFLAAGWVTVRAGRACWLMTAAAGGVLRGAAWTALTGAGAMVTGLAVAAAPSVRAILAPVTRTWRRVGGLLRRFRDWYAALLRRSTLTRVIALLALGVVSAAAVAITAAASPSSHSASYPVFAVLTLIVGLPLICLAVAGAFWALSVLVALPIRALVKLTGRVSSPLVALTRRAAERVQAAGERATHSVHVASRKAAFRATRSLHAPAVAPGGARADVASDGDGLAARDGVPRPTFGVEVHQNEHLPVGGVEVNAVVTVTAGNGEGPLIDGVDRPTDGTGRPTDGTGRPADGMARPSDGAGMAAPEAAEVILLDCSGSMAYPLAKLRAAQEATAAAIDALRDGTWFAVVRATEQPELVYPATGGLAQASAESRSAAKRAVGLMWPEGGTAMGRWLMLARELFATRPGAICHAILLTDGSNESESQQALEAALAICQGCFQCDCRGVGTDWRVKELRLIASRLLGTVDIVAEPAGLRADFEAMIEQAMGKATGDVSLRLWTPQGASVAFVRQVSPTIEDLTARATPVDALTGDYATGAWGEESRDYHLCVCVPARSIGEEMLAARLSLVVDGRPAGQALIRAVWTDDEQLSTRINRQVAHYTGQAELADAIQEGLEARKQGDERTATFKLGRAVRLAAAAGNSDTMKLLQGVVDVQDAHTGTVRLKRRVDDAEEMALDTRSTKTVRVPGARA